MPHPKDTDRGEVLLVAFLRVCAKANLLGNAADAPRLRVLKTLEADNTAQAKATLIRGADTVAGDELSRFGCIKSLDVADSTGKSAAHYEDCVPPDPAVLADVLHGFYFHTDQSGRPVPSSAPSPLRLRKCGRKFIFTYVP